MMAGPQHDTDPGCASVEALADLIDGKLVGPAQATLIAHLDRCSVCRRVVTTLARESSEDAAEDAAEDASPMLGRYVVIGPIGAGAMGEVHRAHDPELDREVAIKMMHPGDPATHRHLAREARALARIRHPNVIQVHDVGVADDRLFIVMDLVIGRTLSAWRTERRRSWREVAVVVAEAGRGLAAAHRAGIVHQDVKPDNILIGDDGAVQIGDFGLARLADKHAGDVAWSGGANGGTPAYMAPEQLRGAAGNARSDQFAFCATLFEALEGRRPFAAPTTAALLEVITRGPAPRLSPDVPPELARVIARGLAADPAARHPSFDHLLRDLDAIIASPRPARRRAVTIGAVITAAIVALILRPTSSRHDPEPSPRAQAAVEPVAAGPDDDRSPAGPREPRLGGSLGDGVRPAMRGPALATPDSAASPVPAGRAAPARSPTPQHHRPPRATSSGPRAAIDPRPAVDLGPPDRPPPEAATIDLRRGPTRSDRIDPVRDRPTPPPYDDGDGLIDPLGATR